MIVTDFIKENNEIKFVMNEKHREINFFINLRSFYDFIKSCVIEKIKKKLL